MLRPTHRLALAVLVALPLLTVAGCSSDDPPEPADSNTATVQIDPNPDALGAPWSLTGPADATFTGTGDQDFPDLEPGSWSVAWGEVSGWITPPPETREVSAGELATFRGNYVQEGGNVPVVVDHRAVLDFDAGRIPQLWIDEVKSQGILIHLPGRSHAQQMVGDLDGDPVRQVGGLKTLESMDPEYAVAIECDLADLPASGALRVLKGQYDPDDGELVQTWECRFDDQQYWTRESGRLLTESTATVASERGEPLDASIYGWSYDIVTPGSTHDEDGNEITFNDERMDTYLETMLRFNDHGAGVIFVYATAPTDDGYAHDENYLTTDGLRVTRYNEEIRQAAYLAGAYLFDQAEIENWNSDFTERYRVSHDGQELQLRHPDWNGSDCAHGGMGICVAKAKALWWLAARLAGWDGTPASS